MSLKMLWWAASDVLPVPALLRACPLPKGSTTLETVVTLVGAALCRDGLQSSPGNLTAPRPVLQGLSQMRPANCLVTFQIRQRPRHLQ
ncbi:hypothetical protein PsasTeo6_41304 [Pseudomonas asiatica]|nr:hypothetical protein PsasTeo6_41304 [Pseudomonas asiatica]